MYAKKPKQKADDDKYAACRGTGVIVVFNRVAPETRRLPVCPKCGGRGTLPRPAPSDQGQVTEVGLF
jgi:DnaJ-class molecular chaperone